MFVDANDFNVPPFNLPDVQDDVTFEDFVNQEEKDILIKVLGRPLYNAFIAGRLTQPIEDRWLRLENGYSYIQDGITYQWIGLKKLLVPYIYSRWLEVNVDHVSGVGTIVANTENSSVVSPIHRIVRGWNKFIDILGGMYCNNWSDTLYGFLSNSGTTYNDVYPVGEFSDFNEYLYLHHYPYLGYKNALGI